MVRVMACGCFDALHPGHVAHLEAARNLGDHLIVALTADSAVNKGPGRPLFPWRERERMLSSLRCVDSVVENYDVKATLHRLKPDIYVKGEEYAGALDEERFAEALGIEVRFLRTLPIYHTTEIITGALLSDRIRAAGSGR